MLRKLALGLVATALIAGPALAAASSVTAGSTPTAATVPAASAKQATPAAAPVVTAPATNAKQTVTPGKAGKDKQSQAQTRKHIAHSKAGAHQANTGTSAKRS
jgi:hypothetical protein